MPRLRHELLCAPRIPRGRRRLTVVEPPEAGVPGTGRRHDLSVAVSGEPSAVRATWIHVVKRRAHFQALSGIQQFIMEITRIAPFLDYLDRIHERTRRVAVLVREEDLEWSATPGRLTPGDLIRHLAGIERFMYAENAHGRPAAYPGHSRDLADGRTATIEYYDRLHGEARELFARLPAARLAEKCLTPAGTPITISKWLRAMIEHEAHHRGQLYFILGMRGVATPPIFGLTAEEVHARSV
jgi:hypothetical protein